MPDNHRPDQDRPTFPELTQAQWALLTSFTDQRCANLMAAADFVADLSEEAKEFLRTADKHKIDQLNANNDFYNTSKAVWKFLWIGGGGLVAVAIAVSHLWKQIEETFSIKFK